MDAHATQRSNKLLTPEQIRLFRDDGIVFPLRVFSSDEANAYRRECDRLEEELGGQPRTVEVRQMHLHFPWAYRLATEPRVLDAVEDLLGPDLLIWATELFAKHPDDRAVSIGWHRDGRYMGLEPGQTLTAWIALTRSSAENGCMRVVREADRKAPENDNGRGENGRGKTVNLSQERVCDVDLQAGEMSLHDVYVLHGSGPNLSPEKRVGFAIRFTIPQAKPTSMQPPAVLVRGEDRYQFFDLQGPLYDEDPQQATVAMRQSARRHLDATLQNLKHAAR